MSMHYDCNSGDYQSIVTGNCEVPAPSEAPDETSIAAYHLLLPVFENSPRYEKNLEKEATRRRQ